MAVDARLARRTSGIGRAAMAADTNRGANANADRDAWESARHAAAADPEIARRANRRGRRGRRADRSARLPHFNFARPAEVGMAAGGVDANPMVEIPLRAPALADDRLADRVGEALVGALAIPDRVHFGRAERRRRPVMHAELRPVVERRVQPWRANERRRLLRLAISGKAEATQPIPIAVNAEAHGAV